MEIILYVYLSIAGILGVATGFYYVTGGDIEEIDGFWDWVIYNLFWVIQPLKAIIKLFKNLLR